MKGLGPVPEALVGQVLDHLLIGASAEFWVLRFRFGVEGFKVLGFKPTTLKPKPLHPKTLTP